MASMKGVEGVRAEGKRVFRKRIHPERNNAGFALGAGKQVVSSVLVSVTGA
jgi:hypothetical protein